MRPPKRLRPPERLRRAAESAMAYALEMRRAPPGVGAAEAALRRLCTLQGVAPPQILAVDSSIGGERIEYMLAVIGAAQMVDETASDETLRRAAMKELRRVRMLNGAHGLWRQAIRTSDEIFHACILAHPEFFSLLLSTTAPTLPADALQAWHEQSMRYGAKNCDEALFAQAWRLAEDIVAKDVARPLRAPSASLRRRLWREMHQHGPWRWSLAGPRTWSQTALTRLLCVRAAHDAGLRADANERALVDAMIDVCFATFAIFDLPGWLILARAPIHTHTTADGRLHNEKGPALIFGDGQRLWAIEGVTMTQKAVEQPQSVTAFRILREEDDRRRRILMRRYGGARGAEAVDRWLRDIGAVCCDSDPRHGDLYLAPAPPQPWFGVLRVVCPSTGHVHHLDTPPDIVSAAQARAWTFNVDVATLEQAFET